MIINTNRNSSVVVAVGLSSLALVLIILAVIVILEWVILVVDLVISINSISSRSGTSHSSICGLYFQPQEKIINLFVDDENVLDGYFSNNSFCLFFLIKAVFLRFCL